MIHPHVKRGSAADKQMQVISWRRVVGQLEVDKSDAVNLLIEHDIVHP